MNQQDPRWNPAQNGYFHNIPSWPIQGSNQSGANPNSALQQEYPPPDSVYGQPFQQCANAGQSSLYAPYQTHPALQTQGRQPKEHFPQDAYPIQTYSAYNQSTYQQEYRGDLTQGYQNQISSQNRTYDQQGHGYQQPDWKPTQQQMSYFSPEPIGQTPVIASYPPELSQERNNCQEGKAPVSAMAVTSLVIGIVALVTSFIPIINNFSFVIAIPGIIFGCIGIYATRNRKKRSLAIAISGLVINAAAAILVLVFQGIYVNALDEAFNSHTVASSPSSNDSSSSAPKASSSSSNLSSSENSSSSSPASNAKSFQDLPLGTPVEYVSGLTVTVNSAEAGIIRDFDGTQITCVSVTYVNNGTKTQSFNTYDWKGQDANGAQRSESYYPDAVDELNSGSLAPGGTITGNLYFEAPISKIVYEANLFTDTQNASWIVS